MDVNDLKGLFAEAGLAIYLLGATLPELGGSEIAHAVLGKVSVKSRIPRLMKGIMSTMLPMVSIRIPIADSTFSSFSKMPTSSSSPRTASR